MGFYEVLINRKTLVYKKMMMAAVGGFFYLVELTEELVGFQEAYVGVKTNCNK
jgi:hypothetical protein